MNHSFNYLINSRALTTTNKTGAEQVPDPQKNYLFDLNHLAILNIEGKKSADFLQGQLTANVTLLSDIQMIQSAQCNLKGRILALFDVINWQGIKLVLPSDLIDATCKSLSKTAMLSRVTVQKNSQLHLFGFYLQNPQDLVPASVFLPPNIHAQAYAAHFCYYHLGNGFYIFVVETAAIDHLITPFIAQQQMLGSLSWHTLRLYEHQIDIYPESRGLFLPHRLNLHQTSYLSFDKGCYKGQEIIARTHYRATLKHELRTYIINTEQKLYSGQKLFMPDSRTELGEVIDYSPLTNNQFLIAVSILKNAPQELLFEQHSAITKVGEPLA